MTVVESELSPVGFVHLIDGLREQIIQEADGFTQLSNFSLNNIPSANRRVIAADNDLTLIFCCRQHHKVDGYIAFRVLTLLPLAFLLRFHGGSKDALFRGGEKCLRDEFFEARSNRFLELY